jgi:hypothetical protein
VSQSGQQLHCYNRGTQICGSRLVPQYLTAEHVHTIQPIVALTSSVSASTPSVSISVDSASMPRRARLSVSWLTQPCISAQRRVRLTYEQTQQEGCGYKTYECG